MTALRVILLLALAISMVFAQDKDRSDDTDDNGNNKNDGDDNNDSNDGSDCKDSGDADDDNSDSDGDSDSSDSDDDDDSSDSDDNNKGDSDENNKGDSDDNKKRDSDRNEDDVESSHTASSSISGSGDIASTNAGSHNAPSPLALKPKDNVECIINCSIWKGCMMGKAMPCNEVIGCDCKHFF